ncbi:MurR/RpiR family transcriptional regulator [Lactococcus allomyrinae]|uniref:MurR/RpiR family transcriptional regulator n=1 Tax=Lactococcus allomyrinae TaxID=2419773 RepID=A0A387BD35_9LACT|nr:MurR/RpiR family transcriptional regulator [Lactococcus allomyrinae]AYG00398.1 MurR/RpiR family transcriptional regulator [Lactococcus allomyrinae]
MMDYNYEKVQTLNDLESSIFEYILKNETIASTMSIREMADVVHVSTATVMRMTKKLGFSGWKEFCYHLKNSVRELKVSTQYHENIRQFEFFLRNLSESEYIYKVSDAVALISNAKRIIFIGVGTSGALAEYGARYFSNSGLESHAITDLHQSLRARVGEDSLVVILSVSGETSLLVKSIIELKSKDIKIIVITNHDDSTLSKFSNITLSYEFKEIFSNYDAIENLTSSLPVIALIEILVSKVTESKKV